MANTYYNQNYSREEIEIILTKIKQCIDKGRCQISLNENRQENINFINEYNIYPKKRKEILMKISIDDFCHSLNNRKIGFEHEVLYVFAPRSELYNALGEKELVDIYTKFNIVERFDGDRIVVVSFHKCNKPVKYLFKVEGERYEQNSFLWGM